MYTLCSTVAIRLIYFSEGVLDKLFHKHDLEQWEVEDIATGPTAEPRWDTDPTHGRRLVILCPIGDGEFFFIALTPIHEEQGVWSCVTAYVMDDD